MKLEIDMLKSVYQCLKSTNIIPVSTCCITDPSATDK